ncbi:MAG: hypothetical protein HY253_06495 [Burkholderiales bacterium]|nr:hypothetical protein [Burkholderiales bacterium]
MINALKERIKQTVPELKFVGEAADFQAAAESNPLVTPACFVLLMDERPGKSQTDVLVQRVEATVGVAFVVKNLKDTKGAAARGALDALRKKVKEQVFGWQASAEFDPFERGASRLLAFRDGHVWWQDLYLTSYYDRSLL